MLRSDEKMRAIEIDSRTDESGVLRIEYQLDQSKRPVRVLILLDEEDSSTDDERLWMRSVSNNPAFAFLEDPEEDVYGPEDGEPLGD
jgi:hypothetical protein